MPAPLEIDQIFRADGLDVIREVERAIIDDDQTILTLNELDELWIAHDMPKLPKVLRRGDDRADDPTRTNLRGSVTTESVSFEQLFDIFAQSAQGQSSVTRDTGLFRIDVHDERWGGEALAACIRDAASAVPAALNQKGQRAATVHPCSRDSSLECPD